MSSLDGIDMTVGIAPAAKKPRGVKPVANRQPATIHISRNKQPHKTVCHLCGGKVKVSRVNVSRCTAVGGPWKSAISCTNPLCLDVKLSVLTPQEIAKYGC